MYGKSRVKGKDPIPCDHSLEGVHSSLFFLINKTAVGKKTRSGYDSTGGKCHGR